MSKTKEEINFLLGDKDAKLTPPTEKEIAKVKDDIEWRRDVAHNYNGCLDRRLDEFKNQNKENQDKTIKQYYQYKLKGMDDTETYNLDVGIANFIVPRLARFKELTDAIPPDVKTEEEWQEILDKMLFSFNVLLNQESVDNIFLYGGKPMKTLVDTFERQYQEGMDLFAKYVRYLWW